MTRPVFRRASIQTRGLDDTLTPREISALLRFPVYSDLPFAIAPLLKRERPARFDRRNIGEHVKFYSAELGARDLIVAFSGRASRLMLPVSYFLQVMHDDLYDILLLTDMTRRHFDGGVEGYSSSFLETVDRIGSFAKARNYRRLITFGTSMGGFPALRAGLQLGADRAVSVGGGFCVHPPRLVSAEQEMGAFDLLCACRPPRDASLFAAFSPGHERDAGHHKVLRQLLPACMMMEIDAPTHNVLHYLDQKGELSSFFAEVFGDPHGSVAGNGTGN